MIPLREAWNSFFLTRTPHSTVVSNTRQDAGGMGKISRKGKTILPPCSIRSLARRTDRIPCRERAIARPSDATACLTKMRTRCRPDVDGIQLKPRSSPLRFQPSQIERVTVADIGDPQPPYASQLDDPLRPRNCMSFVGGFVIAGVGGFLVAGEPIISGGFQPARPP